MDNQVGDLEVGGNPMVESSGTDLSDIPELLEVSDSTSLSPLTSSLDHHLNIQEDNVPPTDVNMGIENTWTKANSSASDCAITLPRPISFDDFTNVSSDSNGDSGSAAEFGPLLPAGSTLNKLFSDSNDIEEETIMDVCTPAGVCGLRNLGNTCFMAAGLQCLTATPTVLGHFLEMHQRGDKLTPPGSLMANFSSLLSKMWSGRCNVVKPTEFKQTLGAYHTQFKDYRQHDCQEFIALLLDSLHEQMNTAKSTKSDYVTANATTANSNSSTEYTDRLASTVEAIVTASNCIENTMETYDNSPSSDCPNSPNVTMAGSPRGDSPMDGLDSVANSPERSPLNGDDETLDSYGILDTRPSFIYNQTQEDSDSNNGRIDKIHNKIYDISKDAKTSNANFLVTQQECNNGIHYDSNKFTNTTALRRIALANSNLTENHDFDNKVLTTKRIKEVNVEKTECISSRSEVECENGLEKCNVKRMKLEDQEKNRQKDFLDSNRLQCLRTLRNGENGAVAAQDEVEADKYWAKHLKANQSVIVDTFQGQFKSTVVCAECEHVSVTYEPFMYLSVPLPHAMERQLGVTYVPESSDPPIRCVVSLNKQSRIGKLKEELLKSLGLEHVPTSNVAIAEVLDNHISRILDDNLLLRYANDTNRLIYAFQLTDPPDAYTSTPDSGGSDRLNETETCQNGAVSANDPPICTICMEELDGDLKKHSGNSCDLAMCDPCIENYFKNPPQNSVTCPGCRTVVELSSYTKIDQTGRPRPAVRIVNVPVVLRHDTNEATNNRKSTELIGHPHLVRLPSRVNAKDLHDVVKRVVPQEDGYTVHFVDGQGNKCSRCLFHSHCTGCSVPETGMVQLASNDNLAVRYTDSVPKIEPPIDHISVSKQRPPHPLSLYDCLQAFSQSEILDEHNPWFCPKCERNQCATKTLTVHRYPKYLIVYLKRFVFHECVSMKLDDKVTFPLLGLNVGRHLYDLYACVCHFGGVSAGHYTAYAKNPQTEIWHYYNDEITSRQKPQEEDFSNAYILFYSRQGTNNSKPSNI